MMAGSQRFGAHEIIVMNEALSSKAAAIELVSHLATLAQDPQLKTMLDQQAHAMYNAYTHGVNLLQQSAASTQHAAPMTDGMMQASQAFHMNTEPKLGLRQPSMPAPALNGQISERSICGIVLNLHKQGAATGMMLAQECIDPEWRQYLVQGALECDRMSYEMWNYMNQKGYYQVPTLLEKTTQTMLQQFQAPAPQPQMQAGAYQ
ncbi:spore coat protein [Alicyclobacillus cellulosilyticus]|nr:spore coat protein [Alicyclobacillus cellulosilyticus]